MKRFFSFVLKNMEEIVLSFPFYILQYNALSYINLGFFKPTFANCGFKTIYILLNLHAHLSSMVLMKINIFTRCTGAGILRV